MDDVSFRIIAQWRYNMTNMKSDVGVFKSNSICGYFIVHCIIVPSLRLIMMQLKKLLTYLTAEIPTKFCSAIKTGSTVFSCAPGAKSNSLWSFSPTSELKIISRRYVDRRQVSSTVDRRSTVACRSHSAFSFVHSTMTTGCDATRRAVRRCQPRLVM